MPIDFIRHKAKTAVSLRGLLLKSFIFGLCWLFLPFWIFLAISVYFYFVPFFQPFKLLAPFLLILAAGLIIPHGLWFAVFMGFLFFLLIGIKNLILVNRFDNHQLMVFLILFLVFFGFFWRFENWQKLTISFTSLAIAFFYFFLFRELADYFENSDKSKKTMVAGLGSFLIWQAVIAILFLPLNYFYQTALLFLLSVILTDLLLEYSAKKLDRRKILSDFSVFLILSSIIIASANWGF